MSTVQLFQPESDLQARSGPARCEICPTRGVCIAASADHEQLQLLPEYLTCSDSIASGDYLFHAGDPATGQFHIRSGMVKTYMITAEGDEYVTGFYLPGEIVGQVHANQCYAESAVALENVSVCELDDHAMEQCAQIGLTTALTKQLAMNAHIEMRHQINLKQTSAQGRFAGYCVQLASRLEHLGRSSTYLPTPMSRTDLASYLGMTLESLSRVISKLHAAQVVRANRDHIEVLQPETINTLGLHVNH